MLDEIAARIYSNLIGRLTGAMQFRLVLQPFTACVIAARDGWKDARQGRAAYAWALLTNSARRRNLLHEGWKMIARVFVLALLMDVIYQLIELRRIYPGEALIVASILAVCPYLLVRGPANRLARFFLRGQGKA